MKKGLLIALLLTSVVAVSQIKISGVVKDSLNSPLEMANILAINKTTKKMASYGFTDAKGRYKLNLPVNTTINLKVSYVGMKSADLIIETKESDIVKDITLGFDNTLDEINIVSKMPVTVKGDTIVYNADSFTNGSERKLEDVLKNLPGVEINEDGEVEVEGKKVSKVMVEGKDFFDGDSKIATKNIPSNAVDKIQVLRNFGEINQLRGVQNNQDNIALNIKLKEGKKSFWFGDVTAGVGSSPDGNLYIAQPKLFYYNPKYSVNVIGDVNNLGEVAFTRRDYFNFTGGFRRPSNKSGTNISLGNNALGFMNLQNNRAKSIETQFGAVNFSYSPKKTWDISGFAIYSQNETDIEQNQSLIYTNDELGIPDEETHNQTNQQSNLGLFKFSSIYKPNVNNQFDYDIIGRFSKETQNNLFNSSVIGSINQLDEATPYSINQNLDYYYTLNDKNIFAFSAQHLLQNEDPFYNAYLEDGSNYTAVSDALGVDTNQQHVNLGQNKKVKSNQLDAKLEYWYVLNKKSNINLTLGTIYSKQDFDSRIFQYLDDGSVANLTPSISQLTDPRVTNDTEYLFSDVYLGFHYQLRAGIFTLTPGFTLHNYLVKNTQYKTEETEDNFQRILPDVNVRMQFKQSESLTFNYRMQTQFTDVNQFARGVVLNSYNSLFSGSPDLEAALSHNVSLRYFSFNMFNFTNVFAFINYNKSVDNIRTRSNFDRGSVVSIREPFNSGLEDESLSASGSWQKTFRKIKTRFRANFNYSKFNQFINDRVSVNENFSQTYDVSVGTNFRKAPNVDFRYRYTVQNNDLGSTNTRFYTNAPSVEFDAYIWDAITFRSEYSYTKFRDQEFDIWDASLSYRKNKDAKWEYQIRASNLLDTKSRVNSNANDLRVSTTQYFIQPRFVSLRLIYSL